MAKRANQCIHIRIRHNSEPRERAGWETHLTYYIKCTVGNNKHPRRRTPLAMKSVDVIEREPCSKINILRVKHRKYTSCTSRVEGHSRPPLSYPNKLHTCMCQLARPCTTDALRLSEHRERRHVKKQQTRAQKTGKKEPRVFSFVDQEFATAQNCPTSAMIIAKVW